MYDGWPNGQQGRQDPDKRNSTSAAYPTRYQRGSSTEFSNPNRTAATKERESLKPSRMFK